MTQKNVTRRGFLGSLAGAAVAPLATTAPATSAGKHAVTTEGPHPFRQDCECAACLAIYQGRRKSPYLDAAALALGDCVAALDRLMSEHCREWCATCLDAHGLRIAVSRAFHFLDGECCPPGKSADKARTPSKALPPLPAAIVALKDARDAMLDLTAFHCGDPECFVCDEADGVLWSIHQGLASFENEPVRERDVRLALAERELLSAERMVERSRRCEAECREMLLHSGREHWSAEEGLEYALDMAAIARQGVHGGQLARRDWLRSGGG